MSTISTARLRLRPFTLDDGPAHTQRYSDADVMRYMPRGRLTPAQAQEASQTVLQQFINHWAERGFGVWAVVDQATGTLLGQCGLRFLEAVGEVEILYLLARPAWGRGLATEAARAAVTFGFEELRLERIIAFVKPDNIASRRVLEKLGMEYQGPKHIFNIDTAYYYLTRPRTSPLGEFPIVWIVQFVCQQ
jgi:ribosomal-protein-alanine N-acetyltransferase